MRIHITYINTFRNFQRKTGKYCKESTKVESRNSKYHVPKKIIFISILLLQI